VNRGARAGETVVNFDQPVALPMHNLHSLRPGLIVLPAQARQISKPNDQIRSKGYVKSAGNNVKLERSILPSQVDSQRPDSLTLLGQWPGACLSASLSATAGD
jgi:hypothetical protein